MRDYAKISTSIWNSRKFEIVDDDAKLTYLYLHTNGFVNSVGCYTLKEMHAIADLGWELSRYRKAIDTLCEAYLVAIDTGERLVRIINFLRFDPFTNPKHAAGSIKVALKLPDCAEKLNLLNDIAASKHARSNAELAEEIDRLSIGYRNPEPEPEPDIREVTDVTSLSSSDDATEPPEEDAPEEIIPGGDEITLAFDAYNSAASQSGWPQVQLLSKARRAALNARLKESGGIDGWKAALSRAQASGHCCGINDRGWVVNFDFLTKQSSFTKLMEGNYDNRHRPTTNANPSAHARTDIYANAARMRRTPGAN